MKFTSALSILIAANLCTSYRNDLDHSKNRLNYWFFCIAYSLVRLTVTGNRVLDIDTSFTTVYGISW